MLNRLVDVAKRNKPGDPSAIAMGQRQAFEGGAALSKVVSIPKGHHNIMT